MERKRFEAHGWVDGWRMKKLHSVVYVRLERYVR